MTPSIERRRLLLGGAALAAPLIARAALAQPALKRVVIQGGAPVPNISYLDVYVGQAAGFFRQQGVEVVAQYTANAALATQIVASGGADLADVTYEPYLLGYDKGLRGKFISQLYSQIIYFFGVPPDSPIKTIADLAGKKIGVSNMGSASLIVARSALRSAGITPTPDMFVPVGVGDSALAALRGGQVQALSLWDAMYAGFERSGHSLRYLFHPTLKDVGNGGMFASDRGIADNRPALVATLKGIVLATAFIRTNPQAAVRIYWASNPAGKIGTDDKDAMEKSMIELRFQSPFLVDRPMDRIGQFNMPGVAKYLRALKQEGAYTADLKPDDLVTSALIDEADTVDTAPAVAMARNWKT